MKDDKVYINQIVEAISKIELFVGDLDKTHFLKDLKTQSAVIMQLTLIGEISKKVSVQTKALIDLPWKDIAGFRDRAIHEYFEIDLGVVWNTIQEDLQILKQKIENFLSQ